MADHKILIDYPLSAFVVTATLIADIAHCLTRRRHLDVVPSITYTLGKQYRSKKVKLTPQTLLESLKKGENGAWDVPVRTGKYFRFNLPPAEEFYQAIERYRLRNLEVFQSPAKMHDAVVKLRQELKENGEAEGVTAEEFIAAGHIASNAMLIALATQKKLKALEEPGKLTGFQIEAEQLGQLVPRQLWPPKLGSFLLSIFNSVAMHGTALGESIHPAVTHRQFGEGEAAPAARDGESRPYLDRDRVDFYFHEPGFFQVLANETAIDKEWNVSNEYLFFLFSIPGDRVNTLVIQDNPYVGHAAYRFVGPLNELLKILRRKDRASDEQRRSELKDSPYFKGAMNHNNAKVGAGSWKPAFSRSIQHERRKC